MTWTLEQTQTMLVNQSKAWLKVAKMDTTTLSTVNPDLAGPISMAILRTGGSVVNMLSPSDDDIETVSSTSKFFAFASEYLLASIIRNYSQVDEKGGPDESKYSQRADRMAKELTRIHDANLTAYGSDGGGLEAGTFDLNFAEDGCY